MKEITIQGIENLYVYNGILLMALAPFLVLRRTSPGLLLLQKGVAVLLVSVPFGVRVGVGNDFENYLNTFNTIKTGLELELASGFHLFNLLLGALPYGFNLFLTICAALAYSLILLHCRTGRECAIALWLTFSLGFCFFANDQIKQSLVAATFVASLKLIEKRRFLPYLLLISVVSLLFHPSGMVLLLAYFVPRRAIPSVVWLGVFGVIFLMITQNAFQEIYKTVLPYVPVYGEIYQSVTTIFEFDRESTGLYVMAIPAMALLLHFALGREEQDPRAFNLVMLGMVVYLVLKYEPLFARLGSYFVWALIPVAARALASLECRGALQRAQVALFVAAVTLYFQLNLCMNLSQHGMTYAAGLTF